MATSRKRERELARRRFERRRQREMERRAATRRRNTIVGSSLGTAAVIAVVVILIVHFAGGSSKKTATVKPAATPTAAVTPTTAASPAPKKCAKISPNPPAKGQPMIPPVKGKVPTKLTIKDVKKGHGRAAQKGDDLQVTYIGVSCDTGKVFDASYKHPTPPTFEVKPLGSAQVITGWNEGLIGIKPGGVRELIIPAALGYGAQGSSGIPPNDTLIFVITAKTVKK